jgi:hypothetical protein
MSNARALNGRAATQADVDAGTVVFYVPDGRSTPYQFGRELPIRARLLNSEEQSGFPAGTVVDVVQAEAGDNGEVLIGFVVGDEDGLCLLHEIEPIE